MALNARQLEVFREVILGGSLTAAAKALNVSQPAASKILRYMESQLGYSLFDRTGGRLIPTAEAQLLFPEADRVFREIEAVRELARRIRETKGGLLRIGASAPPTFSVIPNSIAAFRKTAGSGVKIVIKTLPAEQLGEEVAQGSLDFALSLSPSTNSQVNSKVIGATEVVVVMPSDCPLAARDTIRVADLKGHDLISYGSHAEVGALLDRAFEMEGVIRTVCLEVSLSVTAVPLVSAGLGLALIDGMLPWSDFSGLSVRRFEPEVLMTLYLLTSERRPLQRLAQDFIRLIPSALTLEDGVKA